MRFMADALRRGDELWSSQIVRAEILVGLRSGEEEAAHRLLDLLAWLAVDREIAESAAALGRRYRPSHPGISLSDLIVAATALQLGAELRTRNVRDYPMIPGLRPAY